MHGLLKNKIDKKYDGIPFRYMEFEWESCNCIWEKRNNRIKDPDQKFMLAVLNGRWFASFPCATRFAQTAHQTSCEPFKTTAKFQWFWICYAIISFFSYTRTAIQITTESVCCTILAENFCFHRREALCVSDPSKLQFVKLQINFWNFFQKTWQIGVHKFLSSSVNEHKDYQLISFNIHIL